MNTTSSADNTATAPASRARVPLETPAGLFGRAMTWYSMRAYGKVLEPGLAMAHNRRILLADLGFERKVARFNKLDETLKALAEMAAAAAIECSWCLDFGYYSAHHQNVDPAKLEAVTHWKDADVYTPIERRVLAYAEAVTATPPAVTDELADALRSELGVPAFVELTTMVAVENLRSRFNAAMGLASQGFSESCRAQH